VVIKGTKCLACSGCDVFPVQVSDFYLKIPYLVNFLEVKMSDVLRVGLAVLAGIMPVLERVVDEEARVLIQMVDTAVAVGQSERLREGAGALVTVVTTPSSAVAVVAVEVGLCDTYPDFPERKNISCLTCYLLGEKEIVLMMIRNILGIWLD